MPRFCLLIPIALSAICVAGCNETTPSTALRVACVGDSITWGSVIRDRSINSYPGQLARQLGKGYIVGNFGASGSFVLRSAPKPYADHPFYQESLAYQPDIVVISVGTNDAKPEVWAQGKDAFYESLAQLIDTYRSLPERPRVILALPPPLFAQKERGENLDKQLRPKMVKLALEMDIELIDLAQPFRDKKDLFWDGIHPTRQACTIMASTVAKSIAREEAHRMARR